MSKRWMEKTRTEAENLTAKMPWERGVQRQAMIARRLDLDDHRSKVTLPTMPDGVFLAASA